MRILRSGTRRGSLRSPVGVLFVLGALAGCISVAPGNLSETMPAAQDAVAGASFGGEEVPLSRSTYVAWLVSVPEGGSVANITRQAVPTGSTLIARGYWMWKVGDLSGTLIASDGATWFTAYRTFFNSAAFPGLLVEAQTNPYCGGWGGLFECSFNNSRAYELDGPADWMVLILVGADGTFDGSFGLSLSNGGLIRSRTTGPAFLDREEQFRGDLNVVTENRLAFFKWQERVTVTHSMREGFFGVFYGGSDSGALQMSYDGPDISESGRNFYRFDSRPAGDYTFRVDHDMETKNTGILYVLWAEPTLPT